MLLDATPRKLADAAVHWAAQQLLGENLPDKVGVCRLAWEEETERVLMKWLQDNPKQGSAGLVGGKQKNKNKGLPLHEQAMKAMCYVLMHAAGTEECPISEEGWVKWQQLAAHQSCKRFQNWVLLEALDQDKKDRLVETLMESGGSRPGRATRRGELLAQPQWSQPRNSRPCWRMAATDVTLRPFRRRGW